MTSDEQDAIKALTYRLNEWGVDGAADKASQYVADLVKRGWAMQANHRPIRRPPIAGSKEECRRHIGEWSDFCRSCASERKAARDEAELPTGRWTPERIRESLHATVPTIQSDPEESHE